MYVYFFASVLYMYMIFHVFTCIYTYTLCYHCILLVQTSYSVSSLLSLLLLLLLDPQ